MYYAALLPTISSYALARITTAEKLKYKIILRVVFVVNVGTCERRRCGGAKKRSTGNVENIPVHYRITTTLCEL